MSSLNFNEGLGYALSPEALKRDSGRILILIAASFLAVALNFWHTLKIVLMALDILVIPLCLITSVIALRALRNGQEGAKRASFTYLLLLGGAAAALATLVLTL